MKEQCGAKMREKRRFLRLLTLRKMRYLLSGDTKEWQECAIIDLSRKGMKIRFHEGIDLDSTMYFVLNVPGEAVPLNLKGILKRIEGTKSDFTGGVQLTERLSNETFLKIMNGYSANASQEITGTEITEEVCEAVFTPALKTIPALFSKASFTSPATKQVFSFLSSSVSLFSLVLFLSLPVFFLMVTGYFSGKPIKEEIQLNSGDMHLKEVPSSISHKKIAPPEQKTAAAGNPSLQRAPNVARANTLHALSLREAGGSLYFLALQHYRRADETLFDIILQANPSLTDIREIHDEESISLPVITAESYIKKITDDNYHVHVGTFESMDLVGSNADKVVYLGKSILIEPHRFSSRDIWYRVLLSNFTSKKAALQAVKRLNKKGIIYIPSENIAGS